MREIAQSQSRMISAPYTALKNGRSTVLLLDVSTSMRQRVEGYRKIDYLRDALSSLEPLPGERVIVFGSVAHEVPSRSHIREPQGSTALDRALALASTMQPKELLVVSDGKPDDPDRCLVLAQALSVPVHGLYIGSVVDPGCMWLRSLSRLTGGRFILCKLMHLARLAQPLGALLPP